jgi:hypothetical protein
VVIAPFVFERKSFMQKIYVVPNILGYEKIVFHTRDEATNYIERNVADYIDPDILTSIFNKNIKEVEI